MTKIGDKLIGLVTGIQSYGVFVTFDNGSVGLIHISELKTGFIDNIHDCLEIGQEVTVQVIDVDEFSGKTSLSIRSLEAENYRFPRKHRFSSDKRKYGFEPLKQSLPNWTKEALEFLQEKNS